MRFLNKLIWWVSRNRHCINTEMWDDLCTIDGNTASITVDRILIISLKLKNRDGIKKQGDRNPSRMVMIGRYSKGTDGQMYTSSSIISTYF